MSFRCVQIGPATINNALAPPLLPKSSRSPPSLSSSFLPSHSFVARKQLPALPSVSPRISMRLASKQAYICRDCGFIYSDRTPFDKLPDKYFCPVCGAPKRRFRPYEEPVNKNANSTDVRKARKEQIKKDESIGKVLPYAIAVGIIALAALYFYLNSTF